MSFRTRRLLDRGITRPRRSKSCRPTNIPVFGGNVSEVRLFQISTETRSRLLCPCALLCSRRI
eukprot:UN11791